MSNAKALRIVSEEVAACRKCPRLVRHREHVAKTRRRAFLGWEYWGRPVPGFGDPRARLLLIGLAPAAHGANRTGRMFTGDRSGDFLYAALHRAGFANQAVSTHRGDGLKLRDAYITATARCAPPGNTPLPSEVANCSAYLKRELELLRPRAVLALGGIAFRAYLNLLREELGVTLRPAPKFRHGGSYSLPGSLPRLFAVYHPSQQNTFTGRVTPAMYAKVFRQIRRYLNSVLAR